MVLCNCRNIVNLTVRHCNLGGALDRNRCLLTPLQRLIATTTDLCTKVSERKSAPGGENQANNQWIESTVAVLAGELSLLGPGGIGSEDQDDREAWLSSALAVRLLVPLTAKEWGNGHPHETSSEFCVTLARHVSQRALDCSPEDWDRNVSQILEKLSLSKDRSILTGWQALASSCFVLSSLLQNENLFSTEKARCLALVEMSHSFLQVGLNLLGNRLAGLQLKNNDDGDDEDDCSHDDIEDHAQTEKKMEANAIFDLFEILEATTKEIGAIAQKQALTSPHLRRVNYQMTCIRQFFRLEKPFFQTRQPDAPVVQSNLHDFFANKATP
jgi:hypothetical protein